MKPKTTTRTYYLLRFWKEGEETRYASDGNQGYRQRRAWSWIPEFKSAYRFNRRTDAKSALRSPNYENMVKGHYGGYTDSTGRYRTGRNPASAWNWEIVKVMETTVVSYETTIEDTNAPAMVALARATED
jgi:hypothetical protein